MNMDDLYEKFFSMSADERSKVLAKLYEINAMASANERSSIADEAYNSTPKSKGHINNYVRQEVIGYSAGTETAREQNVIEDKLLGQLGVDSPIFQKVLNQAQEIQNEAYNSSEFTNKKIYALSAGDNGVRHTAYMDVLVGKKTFQDYLIDNPELYKNMLRKRLLIRLVGYGGFYNSRRGYGLALQMLVQTIYSLRDVKSSKCKVNLGIVPQVAVYSDIPIDDIMKLDQSKLVDLILNQQHDTLVNILKKAYKVFKKEIFAWIVLKDDKQGLELLYAPVQMMYERFKSTVLYDLIYKNLPECLDTIRLLVANLEPDTQMEELLTPNLGEHVRKARIRNELRRLEITNALDYVRYGNDIDRLKSIDILRDNLPKIIEKYNNDLPEDVIKQSDRVLKAIASNDSSVIELSSFDLDCYISDYLLGKEDGVAVIGSRALNTYSNEVTKLRDIFYNDNELITYVSALPEDILDKYGSLKEAVDKEESNFRLNTINGFKSDEMVRQGRLREYLCNHKNR